MFVYVCARFFIFSQLIKMIIDERANVGKIQQSIQTLQLGLYLEKEASVHAGWEGSQPDVLTSGYPNYLHFFALCCKPPRFARIPLRLSPSLQLFLYPILS